MVDHCEDHEDHTICAARMKADIGNIKEQNKARALLMMERANTMESDIKAKLNTATFYKVIGILLTIALAVVYAQSVTLKTISLDVKQITINQAVMAKVQDIHLEPMKTMVEE